MIEMDPGKEYVGFACASCQRLFPIAGPLEAPADKPVKIGARGPLTAKCPFCVDEAVYKLRPLRAPIEATSAHPSPPNPL